MRTTSRVALPTAVLRLLVALPFSLLLSPARSLAAWQPDGVPLSPAPVNAQQHYSLRGLAADAANGAFAIWEFYEALPDFSGTNYAIRAQRVDVLGNRPAPWTASGSTIRSWLDNTGFGTYAMTPLGLFEDGSGGATLAILDIGVFVESMTLFRLYGVAPGGGVAPITIMNSTLGGYPVLDAAADGDGAGGAVMIGLEKTFAPPPGPAPPSPLYVQHINAAGSPLWPGTPGVDLIPPGQAAFGLAALADGVGGGTFAWVDGRQAGDPDIYVQHVDATGAIATGWPAGGVLVCDAPGQQGEPHLASDGLGGVIVEWLDRRDPVDHLYAHHVLASGALVPGIPADGRQLPSSSVGDAFVSLVSDGMGGCFVVRAGLTPSFASISHLHHLDAVLQSFTGWPSEGLSLNTLSPSSGAVGVVGDGLGGAYVSFRNGFGPTAPQGLYAQHFAADGSFAPGWTSAGYRLSGRGEESRIVRSGMGAIVAWTDTRPGAPGVYAQRLVTDGPVATLLALVNASASGGRVNLRWFSTDGPALRATVERRTDGSDWAPLAEITADGTGYLEYEDAAVVPGSRYGYRVAWHDGLIARTSAEFWVELPAGLTLALEAPEPNPSSGGVAFAVTLPDARPARLDVFDLAGRRIAARDLGGLGAGRHVIALREAASFAPGLYLVQLTQAGESRRARLVRID